MAAETLPVLTHPEFPQVFNEALLARIRVIPSARTHLTDCYWSDPWCDCRELATVHLLGSEQEFCERHYEMKLREVSRG